MNFWMNYMIELNQCVWIHRFCVRLSVSFLGSAHIVWLPLVVFWKYFSSNSYWRLVKSHSHFSIRILSSRHANKLLRSEFVTVIRVSLFLFCCLLAALLPFICCLTDVHNIERIRRAKKEEKLRYNRRQALNDRVNYADRITTREK